MKPTLLLLALAFASCAPTTAPVADAKSPTPVAPNPLDEPGGQGAGTINFDAYSSHGRFAPNHEQRMVVGLYGH